MDTTNLNAATNPGLANDLISQALADPEQDGPTEVEIKLPLDNVVNLPGGYISADGELITVAEVRELTGRDEEAISRSATVGRMLNTILSRGLATVGGYPANEKVLDKLLAGDRDAIMLGIYKATFGNPAELSAWCIGCQTTKTVAIDLDKDIEIKTLANPVEDREFTVKGRKVDYVVSLPTGYAQRELNSAVDKNISELGSVLLQNTVTKINGQVVYDKSMVQNIGLADRRTISLEIAKRNPGPTFDDVKVTCPDCEAELVVPINLGGLFQF